MIVDGCYEQTINIVAEVTLAGDDAIDKVNNHLKGKIPAQYLIEKP